MSVLGRSPSRAMILHEPGPLSYSEPPAAPASRLARRGRILESCANPDCDTGWLHLWRSRSAPVFEGGWSCSAGCTATRVRAAVARELDGQGTTYGVHRHRVPLGLLMLEQGWIDAQQLRAALASQRSNGGSRLGHWLIAQGVAEPLVTRALGLQWSCPVLPLESHDPESVSAVLPRLFIDAFGALPLRVATGRRIYLGFEDRLDPVLTLAVERMSGFAIDGGLVQGSLFRIAHTRMLVAKFPGAELIEAASRLSLVRALTRALERFRPVESRLVRVHDFLWLRMWRTLQPGPIADIETVHDMVCTVGAQ